MDAIDYDELWRKIPLEEKLELISNSQAQGILALLGVVLLTASFAVAFQVIELFWTGLVFSPMAFQFASTRKYKHTRPILMLSYLAARSAARRYAYSVGAEDLSMRLLFRGQVEKTYSDLDTTDQMDIAFNGKYRSRVWVSLFSDSVCIISEKHGGADVVFAGVIGERFSMRPLDPDSPEYSNDRALLLEYRDKRYNMPKVKLTSDQPAALVAFERTLTELIKGEAPEVEVLDAEEEFPA